MSRQDVEEFLYREASLLDEWDLDGWLELLADDGRYLVPSSEAREGDPESTLYIIADDMHRLRGRVKRLKSREAHAEFPPSRTRRLIANVRVLEDNGAEVTVTANFSVHRFRRGRKSGEYIGRYLYRLAVDGDSFRISERRAILDTEELGALGSISFIL